MKVFLVLTAATLLIAFLIWWPFVVIWALNTLFGLAIASTWTNWLATAILMSVVGGSALKFNRK